MGDLSDANDVDRFLRSAQGKEHLVSLNNQLLGKRITDVTFSNELCTAAHNSFYVQLGIMLSIRALTSLCGPNARNFGT